MVTSALSLAVIPGLVVCLTVTRKDGAPKEQVAFHSLCSGFGIQEDFRLFLSCWPAWPLFSRAAQFNRALVRTGAGALPFWRTGACR